MVEEETSVGAGGNRLKDEVVRGGEEGVGVWMRERMKKEVGVRG